ncbi:MULTISPECIES: hypothetical protein [unclassified Streptomyces]|uniref:hypothetical protein n=1 Tax=unclassified Streptomyces TaxID=2593676 RepID=UPI000892312A|nr:MULTISPECIES: hypothetical protein [unclassified Streptomyces]SDR62021.1 hypothetical protein SAMN05216511_7250 [Streptomyces sp. KS_16]SEE49619.1 hypothetical protein SAMN05428940_7299 [Streptomyces sp. 2133.1]
MPRAKHEPDEEHTATDTAEAPEEAPEPEQPQATEPDADNDDLYEPFPGSAFFHGGRSSEIVGAMGRRLEQEGHAPEGVRLGQDWTNAHKRAFAAHQHTLRPKEGGDVSGIPDEVAWRALRVPRVSPR